MGKKYSQRGYKEEERERSEERGPKQPRRSREGPRSPRMPGFQELMRCSMCGHIIASSLEISLDSQCPKCQTDLRTCKHCRHFDTGAQFECTQPIPKRIRKDVRNECEFFEARKSIERETTSPAGNGNGDDERPRSAPREARSAFDDLFR